MHGARRRSSCDGGTTTAAVTGKRAQEGRRELGKEVEGEGNQRHGRVVVGGSRESERVVAMGAHLGGHGCARSSGVDREQRGSGEASEGHQGSSASSHREHG